MKGAIAMNLIMMMLVINLMLFYAYPDSVSYEQLQNLDVIGLNFTNTTPINISEDYSSNMTFITGNETEVGEDVFGLSGESSNWFVGLVENAIDWVSRAISFPIWVAKFMFAPSVVMAKFGAPVQIIALFTLMYAVAYGFAIFELLTGR